MKKTVYFFILASLALVIIMDSCTKKSPSAPSGTGINPTMTVSGTATATDTLPSATKTRTEIATAAIPTDTHTIAATGTETQILPSGTCTPTVTETATEIRSETCTQTFTLTVSPTITATVTETITGTNTQTTTNTPTATATITPNVIQTVVAGLSNISFASVQAGTFDQEDTDGNNFSHTLAAFKIGQYDVTYELWYTVYLWAINNGYTFADAGKEGSAGTIGAAPVDKYQPVTNISWRDVIVWCNAYSELTGLTPVYYSDTGFMAVLRDSTNGTYGSSINASAGSFDNPYVNWNAGGYRLPTEGEFEYAARWKGADSTNGAIEFPIGSGNYWLPYNYAAGAADNYNDAAATGDVAWYESNSGIVSHDVGGKLPNDLGIYDMSGNPWEWCWDWNGAYPTADSTDYRGPASGSNRQLRGGCYDYIAFNLQAGYRGYYNPPYIAYNIITFRLAKNQ